MGDGGVLWIRIPVLTTWEEVRPGQQQLGKGCDHVTHPWDEQNANMRSVRL